MECREVGALITIQTHQEDELTGTGGQMQGVFPWREVEGDYPVFLYVFTDERHAAVVVLRNRTLLAGVEHGVNRRSASSLRVSARIESGSLDFAVLTVV